MLREEGNLEEEFKAFNAIALNSIIYIVQQHFTPYADTETVNTHRIHCHRK